ELEGPVELGGVELGPQKAREIHFAIRDVPQQKVADALLAAGADQEIDARQTAGRERGRDARLVDVARLEPSSRRLRREAARGLPPGRTKRSAPGRPRAASAAATRASSMSRGSSRPAAASAARRRAACVRSQRPPYATATTSVIRVLAHVRASAAAIASRRRG